MRILTPEMYILAPKIDILATKMDKCLPFEKVQPQWQLLFLFFLSIPPKKNKKKTW